MKKNGKNNVRKGASPAAIIFPLLTLICLAGFIGSLIFPNHVLDTFIMNMDQEEGDREVLLPLSYEKPLLYRIDTQGKALQGVQLGIHKRGLSQEGQVLAYSVKVGGSVVSENVYSLSEGDDLQYVYLPFQNPESCIGDLEISFLLKTDPAAGAAELPIEQRAALTANFSTVDGTETILYDGAQIVEEAREDSGDFEKDETISDPGNEQRLDQEENAGEIDKNEKPALKGSHIYSHDTYPFLYDTRLLTFIFLAVSMTVAFRGQYKDRYENTDAKNYRSMKRSRKA